MAFTGNTKDKKRPSVNKRKVASPPKISVSPEESAPPVSDSADSSARGWVSKSPTPKRQKPSAGRGQARPSAPKQRKKLSKKFVIVAAVLAVVLVAATSVLAWNQWLRYDDAADFQGAWLVEGTTQSVSITESEIQMTEEVAYSYALDTFAKKITFSFDNLTGEGTYVFSPERTTLVITENDPESEEPVATRLVRP